MYKRAKSKTNTTKKLINQKIIKPINTKQINILQNESNNDYLTEDKPQLPIVPISLPIIKKFQPLNKNINKINKENIKGNIIKKPNLNNPKIEVNPYQRNKKMISVKKKFLKDNFLYTILTFLDLKTFYNFMLCCQQFYNLAQKCDNIWYNFYIKKFNKISNNINYEEHIGKWKELYMTNSKKIYEKNYNDLKKKYLTKYKKNIYSAKKDPYYLTNNLYKKLNKPLYAVEIDKKIYRVKYIFTNKILSHINFFVNFDQIYQDLYKIKNINLLFTEQSIGIFRKPVVSYDMSKINLKCTEKIDQNFSNKICKIYFDKELIITTFEKNFIFFINISLPVCKLCENIFDFINGIHNKNLNYECDCDSKFGLYDYSLLINLKSWNKIYFSISVNTCDFKEDSNYNNDLYYNNNTLCISKDPILFDLKSLIIKDTLKNFMIFDIMLMTYEGDHILCESKPLLLIEDKTNIEYDENESIRYIGTIQEDNFSVIFKFNINQDKNYFALINTQLRVNKKYVENIFKKF